MTRDPSALNFADRLAFWACKTEIRLREFVETPPEWVSIAGEVVLGFVIILAVATAFLLVAIYTPDTQY